VDLKHLHHFTVLARELHYGRTAAALGEAQSTLSQQIIGLEKTLGVRLFERSKHRVRLTNAGSVYVNELEPILAQLEQAGERARAAAVGTHGALLIGAASPAMSGTLPLVARTFRDKHPDVELKIRIMHTRDLVEELERSRIHLAFGRAGLTSDRLASTLLWRLPYRVVLPSGHREVRSTNVQLHRLTGETLITYPRDLVGESYDELIAFCRAQRFVPKAIEEIPNTDTMLGLVACGLGVAILARGTAAPETDTMTRPIAGSGHWTFGAAAYWRKDETSPLVRAFLETARRAR
jgi:DNA-binding transcriptional LysR family regulator